MPFLAIQFQDNHFEYHYAFKFFVTKVPTQLTQEEYDAIANEALQKRGFLDRFVIHMGEDVFYQFDIEPGQFDEQTQAKFIELLEKTVWAVIEAESIPTDEQFSNPVFIELQTKFYEFIKESQDMFFGK